MGTALDAARASSILGGSALRYHSGGAGRRALSFLGAAIVDCGDRSGVSYCAAAVSVATVTLKGRTLSVAGKRTERSCGTECARLVESEVEIVSLAVGRALKVSRRPRDEQDRRDLT